VTPFEALLFDLDGTLCYRTQDGEAVYFGAFERAGVAPFGRPEDLWSALDGPPDPDDPESYFREGFDRVADAHDRDADATALARGLLDVVDHAAVAFQPGATDALERAHAHGPVGLLTNGPEHRQAVKLDALGVADAFDAIVYAGDMPRRKPHRDPFDRAVSTLEVAAESTLYVGDSLEYDVAGAQNAGLLAAWCPRSPDEAPDGHRPDYVFETLHDLAALLDGA
jgi:putative hydrolase of the HAD superfamily